MICVFIISNIFLLMKSFYFEVIILSSTIIDYAWSDKKRYFGAPISFTRYSISNDRLFIKTGLLNERQEEILLYRIKDITMTRSLSQKLFGVGSLSVHTNDVSTPDIIIKNIKDVESVKELLHERVEKAKSCVGMAITEIYQ